jgi:hypothetical protein
VLSLLNFGSGYRVLLHKYLDRGAYETICFGCIGMHLSGDIDADFLVRVSLHEVSSLFLIPVDEDFTVSTAVCISVTYTFVLQSNKAWYKLK